MESGMRIDTTRKMVLDARQTKRLLMLLRDGFPELDINWNMLTDISFYIDDFGVPIFKVSELDVNHGKRNER